METRTHTPATGIYPATDDYAHAIEVHDPSRFLFVAGTMGLAEDGTPGGTLTEQLTLIWQNLRTILAAADMTVDNIVRLSSYLRDPAYADENARARAEALGGRRIPTTAIVAQTLTDDWLVEIEIVAAA